MIHLVEALLRAVDVHAGYSVRVVASVSPLKLPRSTTFRRFAAPKDLPQLRELMRNAQIAGLLDTDALSMLEGVLDVADLQVRDIMVPHNQMICMRANDPPHKILAAAIELVSPSNRDRPEARRAFVAKCASYLQRGAGLVIVDVVTDRLANLHEELSAFLAR